MGRKSFNKEVKRLKTFSKWPEDAPVTAESCAKGGFYYTGHGLEVQCYFCGVKIKNWDPGDNPLDIHIISSPNCPFIIDPFRSGNIPIIGMNVPEKPPDYLTYQTRLLSFQKWTYDDIVAPKSLAEAGFYSLQLDDKVRCAYCHGVLHHWKPGDDPKTEHKKLFPKCRFVLADFNYENLQHTSEKYLLTSYSQQNLATSSTLLGPFHAQYENPNDRMRSFNNWPPDKTQTPDAMVDAGFFYTGSGDKVRCFYCNGTLSAWQPEDDPWEQHAKWFPHCRYVLKRKGIEFIELHSGVRATDLDPDVEFIGTSTSS